MSLQCFWGFLLPWEELDVSGCEGIPDKAWEACSEAHWPVLRSLRLAPTTKQNRQKLDHELDRPGLERFLLMLGRCKKLQDRNRPHGSAGAYMTYMHPFCVSAGAGHQLCEVHGRCVAMLEPSAVAAAEARVGG